MGKLLIIEPLAIAALTVSGANTGDQNLLTPDPKEVWQANAVGNRNIDIDMGAAVTVNFVFLGFTNAGTVGNMEIQTTTDMAGAGAVTVSAASLIRPADAVTDRSHGYRKLAAPATSRYFRIVLTSAGPDLALQAGVVALGLAFEPEWDREWGSGRRLIDTGKATQLISGGFGAERGARKAAFSWTFGDLTDAEIRQVWAMMLRLGITDPLMVVERDGEVDGINEQVHYGLFIRIDQWDRRGHNETKWQLEIEEWI